MKDVPNPIMISQSYVLAALLASSNLYVSSFQCGPRRKLSRSLYATGNDDFDPLLSPHAYPNGTDNGKSAEKEEMKEGDWSPMKLSTVKNDFEGASTDDYKVEKSIFTNDWSASDKGAIDTDDDANNEVDTASTAKTADPEFFDPLLSPHAYPKGTDSGPVGTKEELVLKNKEKRKVGILLIDHGSKRASSNSRLETLAGIYAEKAADYHVIKFAHMEIAPPSIEDGIRAFCDEGITDVVCHPYFLSPGRHVLEDIPDLIEDAVTTMKSSGGAAAADLNVRTTEPVGSNMELMVGLITKMVGETLGEDEDEGYDPGFVKKKSKDMGALGGFFGEVQRMVDEQL